MKALLAQIKPFQKEVTHTLLAWAGAGTGTYLGYMEHVNMGLQSLAYLTSIIVSGITVYKFWKKDTRE